MKVADYLLAFMGALLFGGMAIIISVVTIPIFIYDFEQVSFIFMIMVLLLLSMCGIATASCLKYIRKRLEKDWK